MEYSKLTVDQMFDRLVQDDVEYLQELFTTNNINEVYNYLASNHICYCYLHDDEIEDRYYINGYARGNDWDNLYVEDILYWYNSKPLEYFGFFIIRFET